METSLASEGSFYRLIFPSAPAAVNLPGPVTERLHCCVNNRYVFVKRIIPHLSKHTSNNLFGLRRLSHSAVEMMGSAPGVFPPCERLIDSPPVSAATLGLFASAETLSSSSV